MKRSDSFDARHLRPRRPGAWGARLAAALATLLATLGILLAMAGVAGVLGNYEALADLHANRPLAVVLALAGLVLLWLGVRCWRLARLRLRRRHELGLAPHLMKKHD
ncbi:hypothetical protein IV505_16035 [Pseudomonas fulva]|nr:hypothetical protein [Pseudomonas fulva]MBF8781224.1 hypothetical protein [Pseudomonas fulva]